jgi:hypothetical protein
VVEVDLGAKIDKIEKKMCMCVIVRNYKENVLATMCTTKRFIIDPPVTEVVAAWKAIEFCRDL